jgi:hypothetical protein
VLAIDIPNVFRSADFAAVAGWLTRTAVLFVIGGFVAFLHKKETDTWRCFVIGISAPALITTALAGRHPGGTASTSLYITSAFANELPAAGIDTPAQIKVIPLSSLKESSASKFERGFLGVDPPRTYVLISLQFDQKWATDLASSIYRYSQCALKNPKYGSFLNYSELGDLSPPIVVSYDNSAFAIVALFNDAKAANNYVTVVRRAKLAPDLNLDTVSTSRGKAQADFEANVFEGMGDGQSDQEHIKFVKAWATYARDQCAAIGIR